MRKPLKRPLPVSSPQFSPRWDAFGRLLQPLASTVPFMTAVGNHEPEMTVRFNFCLVIVSVPSTDGHSFFLCLVRLLYQLINQMHHHHHPSMNNSQPPYAEFPEPFNYWSNDLFFTRFPNLLARYPVPQTKAQVRWRKHGTSSPRRRGKE